MTQQILAAPISGPTPAPSPRPRDLVQLTLADYYSVADNDGKPIASLLVLIDSAKRPVRAELHLNGAATDESGRLAVRQSQHIIEDRYSGPEELPLQVWQSFLRSEPLHIPLGPDDEAAAAIAVGQGGAGRLAWLWKPISIGVIALILLALLAGIVNQVRGGQGAATPTTADSGGIDAPNDTAAAITIPETALPPVDQPLPAEVKAEIDLPVSKRANPELTIGRRVKIVDGAKLTLRSEAGAFAGDTVGYMQNGDQATIIGGPTQLPGISDTVVWWEVQLDNGKTAWAAANDSNMTLLEPAD